MMTGWDTVALTEPCRRPCRRFTTTLSFVIRGGGGSVLNVTGDPDDWPWASVAITRTVYVVDGERPKSCADTGFGVVSAPICCAHEIVEPPGGFGAIVNWQLRSGVALGLTAPWRVALENV